MEALTVQYRETTAEKIELLLKMQVHSKADLDYIEAEIKREIANAEAEGRVRDSIRLKSKLLELSKLNGAL
jgi:hypothetical protein